MNNMKRFSVLFIAILLITSGLFAQEDSGAAVKVKSESKAAAVRIGGFGQMQPVTGPLAEFLKFNVGGGLAIESDIHAFDRMELGFVVGGVFNANPVKVDTLKSVINFQAYLGMCLNVPFGESGFTLHPEVDYGIAVYKPTVSDSLAEDSLKKTYIDQLITVNLGLRFSNPAMAKGRLEFELAPSLSLTPEKDTVGVFAGGRIGMFYRIGGPDAVLSEKAMAKKAAKEADKAARKAEKAAAAAEAKAKKNAANEDNSAEN